MRALFALAALAAASSAQAAQLFVSTERPFAPDSPGAILKLEVPVAHSVDVRLYRLDDPERFFAGQDDLLHVSRPEARAEPAKKGEAAHRSPGALALVRGALSQAALDARAAFEHGLSPAARALASAAVQGPAPGSAQALPFLHGLELVERWDLACGTGEAGFSYCDLDLGPRPAGTYLVEAVAGREVAHAVALFSNLSLVARRTEGHVTLLAVDSRTGAALPNVHLAILVPGQAPLHGTTTPRGLFFARIPARPARVFGQLGADAAVLEISPVAAVEPERSTLLLTDRGEYRAGERVAFHGFARTADERAPRAEKAEVAAYDARGSLFFGGEYPLSAQGGFGGELALPPGLPQGLYRLVATVAGRPAGAEFAVRDAPAPAFVLEAALEATTAGAPARAAIKATTSGRPLPDVEISWRAMRSPLVEEGLASPEEIERGEVAAGADGRATFDFATLAGADARYEIEAVGRDAAGRIAVAQASATVLRRPLRVSVTPERRLVAPGAPVLVSLAARGEADRPIATDLKVRVLAAHSGVAEGTREKVLAQELRTGADGRAATSFTPLATGYYEVEVAQGDERLAETFVYVTAEGGDIPFSPEALALVPDKPAYAVGETARLLLLAPFDAATALLTVEGSDLVRHDALAIRGASAVYTVKVTPQLAPDFTVSAQAIFNGKAWRTERVLHVTPRGEPLSVRGTLSAQPSPPGAMHLEVEVLDRAGKPVPGAEVFAVARDALSVEASAPPILAFFHPTRLSDGATASSTSYRNSSSGRSSASDGVEEGYLPFKGLAQGRPRPRNAGTLLATSVTTDARGRASFAFAAPAQVARVAAQARVVAQAAMGEWSGATERGSPAVQLLAPRFLRPGDEALARASAAGASVELALESSQSRAADQVSLALAGAGRDRTLLARFEGAGRMAQRVAAAPSATRERRGACGVAGPGRTPLPLPEGALGGRLVVSASPLAQAAAARAAMGEAVEPMTERRVARLLLRLAEWRAKPEPAAELRAAALADVAALVGYAHPEGSFGPYDGGPADLELTASALVALALAREEGLDVEEGELTRGAGRLLAHRKHTAMAALALCLLDEAEPELIDPLLAADRAGSLGLADRALLAWALEARGDRPGAHEVASRLERAARLSAGVACFAESCPLADAPRPAVRATALAVLALHRVSPKSPLLAPSVRFLVAQGGAGDFGGDPDAGFAALAIATAADALPARPARASAEAQGKQLASAHLSGDAEAAADVPSGPASLLVSQGGPVYWRLSWEAAAGDGAIHVERSFAALDAAGQELEEPIHAGDRVRVTLRIRAEAKAGPVRIEDPYPAGLAPVEQEGEHEAFRELDEQAQRLFLPDRLVFLLPSLKAGDTELSWEATARVAGKFTAAPATVAAGAERGQSSADALAVEEAPR